MAHRVFDVAVSFIKNQTSYEYTFTVGSSNEQGAKRKGEQECKRRFSQAKNIKAISVSERKYKVVD